MGDFSVGSSREYDLRLERIRTHDARNWIVLKLWIHSFINAVDWGDGDIDNGFNQFWNISSDRTIEEPEHHASQSSDSRAVLPADLIK